MATAPQSFATLHALSPAVADWVVVAGSAAFGALAGLRQALIRSAQPPNRVLSGADRTRVDLMGRPHSILAAG